MNQPVKSQAKNHIGQTESLSPAAIILRKFAIHMSRLLQEQIDAISSQAIFRKMKTPGGRSMSVAMTNCGKYGWVSDCNGYRYTDIDPETGNAWPPMPGLFQQLAESAATVSGYDGFNPDVCLINHYGPGARMGLHQDRDEKDFSQPIVSVSLGVPAVFLWGGFRRKDKPLRVTLNHGDVIVWGGADRLRFHGIASVKSSTHPEPGANRYNLTFRKSS